MIIIIITIIIIIIIIIIIRNINNPIGWVARLIMGMGACVLEGKCLEADEGLQARDELGASVITDGVGTAGEADLSPHTTVRCASVQNNDHYPDKMKKFNF